MPRTEVDQRLEHEGGSLAGLLRSLQQAAQRLVCRKGPQQGGLGGRVRGEQEELPAVFFGEIFERSGAELFHMMKIGNITRDGALGEAFI